MVARIETTTTATASAPSSGLTLSSASAVGGDRPDRPALVQLDQRPGSRRLDEADADQRQRRHEGEHQEDEHAAALAVGVDPRKARGSRG